VREFRIRRDHPEIENGKPSRKYVSPVGCRNMLYVPVGTAPEELADASRLLVLTEGEFKAIALRRAACLEAHAEPRFTTMAVPGVGNWHGRIGKMTAADGTRVDEKGPVPDLARLEWEGRRVLIAFDRDADANPAVIAERKKLTKELQGRGPRSPGSYGLTRRQPPKESMTCSLLSAPRRFCPS
jgi:hypothetical protein